MAQRSFKMKKYGLLFDLEYCVGCKTCCVACQQENGFDGDSCGIFINEHIYKKNNGRVQVDYLPFPTQLCNLCEERISSGFDTRPSCVKHCPSACIEYGDAEELYEKAKKMVRPVIYLA